MKPTAAFRFLAGAVALGVALTAFAPDAAAVRFRRPFNTGHSLGYGYDHNFGGAGCADYNCGGRCYDGHGGNDYPLPIGTGVVAAADGTVSAAAQGCADWGFRGSTCNGGCGNYVRITYDDGSTGYYCHLKNGTVAVSNGQRVSCGQHLGQSASSGNSSGPHLHFDWRPGGSRTDPYAGPCSQSTSYWVGQNGYWDATSTDCETHCECTPGQSQSEGCGNCGTRQRSCGGDCRWGGWSGCENQGPCAPGQGDSRACCDCGTQSRSCGGNCQWGDWGACAGPDPAGPPPCATGEPGVCAAGAERCVEGCLRCVRLIEPSAERCDDLDNDCDGPVDEDEPQELGDPPPRFAARLVDASAPGALWPGEASPAFAIFENVGSAPWAPEAVWLRVRGNDPYGASELWDVLSWPAYDVVAGLAEPVPPGERAIFVFNLRAPAVPLASFEIAETFGLVDATGWPCACPRPTVSAAVALLWPPPAAPGGDAPSTDPAAPAAAKRGEAAQNEADLAAAGADGAGEGPAGPDSGGEPFDAAAGVPPPTDVRVGAELPIGCAAAPAGGSPPLALWFGVGLLLVRLRRSRASR